MRRAFLIVCAFLATLLVAAPAYAADGSYSIDEISSEVSVLPDGSVRVVERQVLTFAERNQGLVWYLHAPESGESVRINGMRYAPVDDGGTAIDDWLRLQMVDSKPAQQGWKPGDQAAPSQRGPRVQPWYSYNIGDGIVRCYFPTGADALKASENGNAAADGATGGAADAPRTYAVETDYTVSHRVRLFRDVAELYWRYVNDSLPADANDATLQIALPVPAGEPPAAAGDAVAAWGHGPGEGTFDIGENGAVTYHIDLVERGNFAEAHVIFPIHWMTDVSEGAPNIFAEQRRNTAFAEEAGWVDAATRGANWDYQVRVLFLAVMVAVILAGTASVLRGGRSPRSRRALVRVAATLAIIALGEHLFFREPLTTAMLALAAVVVAAVSFMLPVSQGAAVDAGGPPSGGAPDDAPQGQDRGKD